MKTQNSSFLRRNAGGLIVAAVLILLPFVVGLFEGASPAVVWANEGAFPSSLKVIGIEILILALFALSFDLLFGVTGLLSFGHAMFFAVAAI